MNKKWLIAFKKKGIFGYKHRMAELWGSRSDSVLNAFDELYPDVEVEEIYVEYLKRS